MLKCIEPLQIALGTWRRRMKSHLLHKARELLDVLERTTGEPGDLLHTLQHIAQTAEKFFVADASAIFSINPIDEPIR